MGQTRFPGESHRVSSPVAAATRSGYGHPMAHVVVFHHAQGLSDGTRAFADHLRADGHEAMDERVRAFLAGVG